jgi:hypothetical protein
VSRAAQRATVKLVEEAWRFELYGQTQLSPPKKPKEEARRLRQAEKQQRWLRLPKDEPAAPVAPPTQEPST